MDLNTNRLQPEDQQATIKRLQQTAEEFQKRSFRKEYWGAAISRVNYGLEENKKIEKWVRKPNQFLLAFGGTGIGKTYFCSAAFLWIKSTGRTIRYWDEATLFSRARGAISQNQDYYPALVNCLDDDVVIIDDIGSSGWTEWREEILLAALDYLYSNKTPSILTSNLTKYEIQKTYHDRIASRLFDKRNTILDLSKAPDLREADLE